MNKLFEANVFFKLDDEFKGTVIEALRQMADYLENAPRIEEEPLREVAGNETRDERWVAFTKALEDGRRLHGDFRLTQLEQDGNVWKDFTEYFPKR